MCAWASAKAGVTNDVSTALIHTLSGVAAECQQGGTRVIYFCHDPAMPLYLLTIYAKARAR
jgi:hypothetical protein